MFTTKQDVGEKAFYKSKTDFHGGFFVLLLPFFLCNSVEEKETILMSWIIEKNRKSSRAEQWNQHENS
jgi:hypothetical protein